MTTAKRPAHQRAPSGLRLSITAECGQQHVAMLRRYVRRAAKLLQSPLRELSIALVGDRRMGELHMQFLSLPGPTDVLTFPLDVASNGDTLAGEVIICVPYARRSAKQHGTTPANELLLYAIHGMLHLSGYDDLTAKQYKAMHQKEDQLLTELGVGAVFSPQATSKPGPGLKRQR
jgi:probable rRNA maturation factor